MPYRSLLPFLGFAIALAYLVLPLSSHASLASELLFITSDVTYDIRPDAGPVHVSWKVQVENRDPDTVERESGRIFFYQSVSVPILHGFDNLKADSGGTDLDISPEPSEDGPLVPAIVSFDRRLFFGQTYSFSLDYDLPSARADSLLVTPYYVFLPAVSSGDQSTVTISTPADRAWEVNLEPFDCEGSDSTYTCAPAPAAADKVQLAALAEVSRPDAAITIPAPSPLEDSEVTISYFPGDEAWAEHLQDLVVAALPVLEDLYGFPIQHAKPISIAERGQQLILGYEGLSVCGPASCDIGISPIADDLTALHELAHLWSDVYDARWLKEGFAHFMAERATQTLGPGLVRWSAGTERSVTDFPLDEWGEVTYIIAATSEEQEGELAGYDLSVRFLRRLEEVLGFGTLQETNARLSQDTEPADSRRYMDVLEETSGENLDALFLEWVFPDSFEPILAQRRQARDRLASLTMTIEDEGLNPEPLESIRAHVSGWRFENALAALIEVESGIETYLGLSARLLSLRDSVEAAGLGFPQGINEAIDNWEFDRLERLLGNAEAALQAYSRADDKVHQSRNLLERVGLWGRDPEGSLARAAVAFTDGDFEDAITSSDRAYDLVDDAWKTGLIRSAIVVVLATAVVGATMVIWLWLREPRGR